MTLKQLNSGQLGDEGLLAVASGHDNLIKILRRRVLELNLPFTAVPITGDKFDVATETQLGG